ncbi:MAG: helix-hairpin-helix domain-containing protein [Oscillospiraceae bacterium]
MKKPFSIVDAALNVIRVCLAAGILITLFDFFTRIDQTPAIVIRFPKSAETEETSGYEPEYTTGTQIIQKSRGYKKPELLTEEPEPEISAIAETEPILISTERETASEASANYAAGGSAVQILQTSSSKAEETADAADSENSSELININTAPASELVKLKGIGEVKAAAIVEYRRINGNFKTVQDIMNVSGIGEKTFEKIRSQIMV